MCDGTASERHKDFYISHNSDDKSLFEDNIDDVTEEVDEPIVSYGQHIDGRVSTFVHIPERTGEDNLQYINENDDITTL